MRAVSILLAMGALAPVATAQRSAAQTSTGVPRLAFEKTTLPNGLEVILHEDHSTPIVVVNTWYKVGSGDEKPGRTGFAHLFEHIMFMGSEHVPTGQFDKLLESVGANNNGSTTEDRTNYYESLPSNALPLALWLDADRMGHLLPVMDQAKLDLQRDVVKNERRQRVDNVPYGKWRETVLAALYPPDHPYHWPVIGSMADLSAASLEDVKQFFRTYYAPNNATLVIAGDFNRDSALTWVNRYFGGIPRGPQMPPRPVVPAVTVPRDTFLVLEDRVVLPRLFEVWETGRIYAPDDAPLDVLADVLAGDKNSRLYKRLVFDMQVAQDVTAFNNSTKLDGNFNIIVTPKPGQTPTRMAELVKEEIDKVAKDGITPRELARALNSRRASFLDQIASVLGKSDRLAEYNYFAGTPDYIQRDAARYDHVTAADVQRVAAQYLTKPKVVLTVVPQGKTDLMVTGGTR
ncbi:MAG TPA: pitrilysin family protein [Gemmatimonadaceae bacterium]|nr:pitrilysin family protein [Gemmatimonadaceae bacterium]